MSDKKSIDQYAIEDTEKRRDDALRRALSTPPQPKKSDKSNKIKKRDK